MATHLQLTRLTLWRNAGAIRKLLRQDGFGSTATPGCVLGHESPMDCRSNGLAKKRTGKSASATSGVERR
jgi:hypothetical protein